MKVVLVGGSGSLGTEIIAQLEDDAYIVNVSRSHSSITNENILIDLKQSESIDDAIKLIQEKHDDCSVLIYAAGQMHWFDAGENPSEIIDEDVQVNLTGAIKVIDKVIPIVEKNEGDVIIIGSSASYNCYPGSAVYNAAKHGLMGYIKSLQAEYKAKNVRVIGIHPGGFKGQFHVKAASDLDQNTLMDAKDVASAVKYALTLPRTVEVSDIRLNRNKGAF